jgi:hypothetical protein
MAREFAPHRLTGTLRDLAAAQQHETARADEDEEAARKIAECDRRLAQYRAALDAEANPATVAAWIAETEIRSIATKVADIARVLADADPADKAEIFRQLGLKLTYHPGRRVVEAEIDSAPCGFFESVRGGIGTIRARTRHRVDRGVRA